MFSHSPTEPTAQRAVWISTDMSTRGGIASFVRAVAQTPLWSDWQIDHVATHRDGSTLAKVTGFIIGFARTARILATRRPTLVHLHTASYGSFARKSLILWLARLFRVPVVLHVHGAEFDIFHDRFPRPLQLYIRASLHAATSVVALGNTWRKTLLTIAPAAHVTVIPNAVAVPSTPPRRGDDGQAVNVLFLGRVGERKGTFDLLDAWAQLRPAAAEATLTIAGDGETERARESAAALALDDTVTVTGWVGADAVETLLDDADLLVLPSYHEGLPMAVLEAMAHRLPVVATEVGSIGDVVDEHTGILVPVGDPPALAQAVKELIEDKERRERLGENGYQRVLDNHVISDVVARIDALYRTVSR